MCIIPVRHKVKELIELVQDDDRLKQERKRAKKNRDKYKGVSSEAFSRGYSKLKDAVVLSWRAKKRARVYKYPVFVPVKILQSNNHAPFLMIQYFWGGRGEILEDSGQVWLSVPFVSRVLCEIEVSLNCRAWKF